MWHPRRRPTRRGHAPRTARGSSCRGRIAYCKRSAKGPTARQFRCRRSLRRVPGPRRVSAAVCRRYRPPAASRDAGWPERPLRGRPGQPARRGFRHLSVRDQLEQHAGRRLERLWRAGPAVGSSHRRHQGLHDASRPRPVSRPNWTMGPTGIGERIRKIGREYGTVTGRPRRVGWFDAVAVRYTAALGGVDELALMLLDVLERSCRRSRSARRTRRPTVDTSHDFPADAADLSNMPTRAWRRCPAGRPT